MEKPKTNSREENLTLINTNIHQFSSFIVEHIIQYFSVLQAIFLNQSSAIFHINNFSFSLSHLQFGLGFQFQFHCFYKLDSNLFLNFCCFCKQIYGQEAPDYVPITLHECFALYFFLLFIYFIFCSFSLLDL